jgi:hypothetical protein
MYRILKFCLPPFLVAVVMAADPAWKSRTIQQWDAEDAKQVLINSPWVKRAIPALLPQLTEDQRREGGQMGGGKGVGLDGLGGGGLFGRADNTKAEVAKSRASKMGTLAVRWESAFPVRAAELKAQELGAPDWDGDFYAIAVYDIPGLKANSAELKRVALLKRDGKKDIKPARVDILQSASGLATVVYLFPRSDEIIADDKQIKFTAQIAQLYVEVVFNTGEMEFQGKLQL